MKNDVWSGELGDRELDLEFDAIDSNIIAFRLNP